mgnify:CR=1 FL=1
MAQEAITTSTFKIADSLTLTHLIKKLMTVSSAFLFPFMLFGNILKRHRKHLLQQKVGFSAEHRVSCFS